MKKHAAIILAMISIGAVIPSFLMDAFYAVSKKVVLWAEDEELKDLYNRACDYHAEAVKNKKL